MTIVDLVGIFTWLVALAVVAVVIKSYIKKD